MHKAKPTFLLHPVFIGSCLLLLLNDHYWKYQYANWVTGKLSDVTGLVVLPAFLLSFYPVPKQKILLFSALFFCWWKSPLSEPVIRFCNSGFSLPLERVVDYSDLLALAVLPLVAKLKPVKYATGGVVNSCCRIMAGLFACVSLCSTSVGYRHGLQYGYRENRTGFHQAFETTITEEEVIDNLKRKGFPVGKDSSVFLPVLNANSLYYRIGQKYDSSLV